jgi:hypothetical protein
MKDKKHNKTVPWWGGYSRTTKILDREAAG